MPKGESSLSVAATHEFDTAIDGGLPDLPSDVAGCSDLCLIFVHSDLGPRPEFCGSNSRFLPFRFESRQGGGFGPIFAGLVLTTLDLTTLELEPCHAD